MLTKIDLSKNLDITKLNIETQQFKITLFCNGLMYIWQNKDDAEIISGYKILIGCGIRKLERRFNKE